MVCLEYRDCFCNAALPVEFQSAGVQQAIVLVCVDHDPLLTNDGQGAYAEDRQATGGHHYRAGLHGSAEELPGAVNDMVESRTIGFQDTGSTAGVSIYSAQSLATEELKPHVVPLIANIECIAYPPILQVFPRSADHPLSPRALLES